MPFVVEGAPGDIHFKDVAIANPVKLDTMPEGLSLSDKDRDREREKDDIKITREFPAGPGGKKRGSDNVGGQVGGQVIEQAIRKGIFSF